ncbi:MAG: leucine-rich repeat protein [Prevotellaceae bacterium]|nr:leucine-rich repeat protein [Candidatus Colivivens equi]
MNNFSNIALLCLICLLSLSVKAENVITIEQAGTLSTLLSSDAQDATIIGPINGTDVKYLRQLINNERLSILDLSDACIVSGGGIYFVDEYNKSFETKNNVLGGGMFKECKNLTSIKLPASITKIEQDVFPRCSISQLVVPDKVVSVDWYSLADCPKLKEVVFGKKVSTVGPGIFWNTPVKNLYLKPLEPPSLDDISLSSSPTIHVYQAALSAYQASDWAQYGTIVGDLENYYPYEKGSEEIIMQQIPNFFNDYSCSSLKPEYQNMDDDSLISEMIGAGMSEFMVDIAKKLKNEDWASYEKDFRIHSYKAYSDANYWNNKLFCYGGSYMGNPTGIYSSSDNPLYVFVDQDIPSDATLYIGGCVEYDEMISNAKYGTKLKKGLNIIDGQKDALYYIIYTADTQSMTKKLSEWPAIKIHIEGGIVNGYYDVNRHSDADYQAILKNATHERFIVKGNYSAFIFKTESFRKEWPKTIDQSISWFDSITVWEKEVMGICTSVADGYKAQAPFNLTGGESFYPDYFNNPNWAIEGTVGDPGWANASSYRTSYNGFDCVAMSLNVARQDHGVWCASHETGHQNQKAITLEACGEVSNNLFSNIMSFLDGRLMSQGRALSTTIDDYVNDKPFFGRDIWSMMRMYYQLYLYYHQAQKNTSFYPTLFKELRKNPLELWGDTNNSTLKFVRKVCEIANEDLTDFFTAWGFFVPCENYMVDDYGYYKVTVKQSDIEATLKEISKYPRKNREILFIEDRINLMKTSGFFTVAGQDRRDTERMVGTCGELGQFTEFLSEPPSTSEYTYLQSDSLFIFEGKGGVGFIVLDEDDQLLFASNNKKFCIPSHILKENYTIYSVDADGTLHPVKMSEDAYILEDAYFKEINVKTAGTLSSLLSSTAITAKISGSINGSDIKYLRQLINNEQLMVLDLSDARIVKGGGVYFIDEYNNPFETKDDVLGGGMFKECRNLASIKLPVSITKIEQDVFPRCQISQLVVPDNVVSVEWYSLADCPNLKEVVLGEKVSKVGPGVFWSTPVKNLYLKPLVPPSVDDISLSSNPTIHVYESALSAYQASDWAQYGTIVGDLDEVLANDIQQIRQDQQGDESIYNLFGQKVKSNAQDAILIKGGKKILIR